MLSRIRRVRSGSADQGFSLPELIVGSTLALISGTIATALFVTVSAQANETTTREQLSTDNRVALNQIAAELRLADSPAAIPISADGRFEVFAPDKVTFYDNRDSASRSGSNSRTPPSRVTIERSIDSSTGLSKLVMSIWNPKVRYGTAGNPYPDPYSYPDNYPAAASQTMTLAQGVGNDTSKPNEAIFSYCSAAPDPAPTSSPTPGSTAPPTPDCNTITMTGDPATDSARATQISSVIVRLKVGGAGYSNTNTGYQPATWLTTRVAISGKVVDP